MNKHTVAALFIAEGFGSGVLFLPRIVVQLGAVPFVLVHYSMVIFFLFCALLSTWAYQSMLATEKYSTKDILRNPLQVFSKQAYGKCFGKFMVVFHYVVCISMAFGMALLAASTLQMILPLPGHIEYLNQIRIWLVILFALLIPPSLFGTFQEHGVTTYVAFGSILFSECCIIVSSILVYYTYLKHPDHSIPSPLDSTTETSLYISFITNIGTLAFTASGICIVLANAIVTMDDASNMDYSVVVGMLALFTLVMVSGFVPVLLLKNVPIETSIMSTLTRILHVTDSTTLSAFIVMCQVSLVCHFYCVFILMMNPINLYTEEYLQIPKEFGWHRVLVRCALLAMVCGLCVAIPAASPVISWVGGVPVLIFGTLIPIALYFKVIPSSTWLKGFCGALAIVLIILIVTINCVDLYTIIQVIS